MAEGGQQDNVISKYTAGNIQRRREENNVRLPELEEDIKKRTPNSVIPSDDLRNLARRERAFERLRERSEKKAAIDTVTGLQNRRLFNLDYGKAIERARRGEGLSLGIVDIDHYGAFNAKHGMTTGDVVLKEVAQEIVKNTRAAERVYRVGGEEFTLIEEHINSKRNINLSPSGPAERIRKSIENLQVAGIDDRVTISIGVADFVPGDTPDSLFYRADAGKRLAKLIGRNTTVVVEIDEAGKEVYRDVKNRKNYRVEQSEKGRITRVTDETETKAYSVSSDASGKDYLVEIKN